MAKRTVRLTESELKRVITESVKNILSEGKYENNKPYFYNQGYNGDMLEVVPGEKARGNYDDYEEMEKELNDLDLSDLGYTPEKAEEFKKRELDYEKERFKHNDRLKKYNGPYDNEYGEFYDYKTVWRQNAKRREQRKDLDDFLKTFEMDYSEYKALPNSEKIDLWKIYYNCKKATPYTGNGSPFHRKSFV